MCRRRYGLVSLASRLAGGWSAFAGASTKRSRRGINISCFRHEALELRDRKNRSWTAALFRRFGFYFHSIAMHHQNTGNKSCGKRRTPNKASTNRHQFVRDDYTEEGERRGIDQAHRQELADLPLVAGEDDDAILAGAADHLLHRAGGFAVLLRHLARAFDE